MPFLKYNVVLSNVKKDKTFITSKYKLPNFIKFTNSLYSCTLLAKKKLIKIKALAREVNSTKKKKFANNCYGIKENFQFCLKTSCLKPLPLFGLIYGLSFGLKNNNSDSKTMFKLGNLNNNFPILTKATTDKELMNDKKTSLKKNKIIKINYSLESFHRSNQDTILLHKPSVFEGQWVESGDLLADCSTSVGGDLSLGQNILIGYMPWEGYNFEDAILISERLVYDDLYTSIHIEKYQIEIKQTELGIEQLTREIPEIEETEIKHLDKIGIAKLGTWVEEGDILVGKITPIKKKKESPYKKLLYTILEKQFIPFRDSSLRAPKGAKAKVIDIKFFRNGNFLRTKKKKEKNSKLPNKNKRNFSQTPTKILSKKKEVIKLVAPKSNFDKNTKQIKNISKNHKLNNSKKENLIRNQNIKNDFLKNQLVSSRIKKKNSSFKKTIFSRLKFFKLQKKKSKPFFNRKGLEININKIKKFNYLKNSVINEMNKTNLIIEFSNSLIVTKKKQIKLNLAKIYSKKKFLYLLVKRSNKLKINSQNKLHMPTSSIKSEYLKNKKKNNFNISHSPMKSKPRMPNINSVKKNKKNGWKFSHNKKLTTHKTSTRFTFQSSLILKSLTKINKFNKNQYFKAKKLPSFSLTIKRNDSKKNLKSYLKILCKKNLRRKTYKKLIFKKKNRISQKSFKHYKHQRIFFFKNKIKNKKMIKSLKGSISSIHIYLADKRKIQIGDKMSGRHGNKGIVSQILPREDMPYLPDGTPLDMVLNPLGVPSRMNVGQIYECLLGLAGKYLGEKFEVLPFDEIYGPEASRSFVYSKLYEARIKTAMNWLYDPNNPGKMKLYDGRTGDCFDQTITVGQSYILRLVHMVDDKIHARSIGPYSLVTQQPLRGRSKQGGQRLGEMEVWALEGYGAAFTLLEMLTIKSDDMTGRMTLWSKLLLEKDLSIGTPESFKVLLCELQALCLDIGLFRPNPLKNYHLEKIETLISLR
jgi:DNA-directed RNA polymerase beta subunit